jgi:hypothetical protein
LADGYFAGPWLASKGEPFRLTTTELTLFLEGARMDRTTSLSPKEVRFSP